MTHWITSDLHFNHKAILQYCPARRSGREMPTEEEAILDMIEDMNSLIIRNWNSLVDKNDTVWVLGDAAMGQIFKAPALIKCLNGKKHLIKGNHDKTLCKFKINGNLAVDELFETVQDTKEMTYKLGSEKVSLFMSHYPHHSWPWSGSGSIMYHGHTHGTPTGLEGRIKDCGADTNNLYPYLMDTVVEEMLNIKLLKAHH